MSRGKRIAAVATAALVGAAVVGVGSPANAAGTFVTPMYGMTCYTSTGGGFGNYWGSGTCWTPSVAIWKVEVDCSFGGSWSSAPIQTSSFDGWVTRTAAPTCYWGVNSVRVVELTRTP
jgi:hypothetical protein